MANTDAAFGLRPVRHTSGAPWNGQILEAYISADYGTALYIGDPVLYTATTGEKDSTGTRPTINRSAGTTGTIIRGVIVNFAPLRTNLEQQYNPASTERLAYITPPDPSIVFHVQDDGDGTPAAGWAGLNAVLAVGAGGSTVTGKSGYEIAAGTAPTTTQAHPVHILGLARLEDNELGDFGIWEVVLNTVYNATGLVLGVA